MYQYRGMDVYGARCALLHAYASETDYHQKRSDAVRFAYHDGGQHFYDPAVEPRLVLIGTASFLNDVMHAVGEFLNACRTDKDLQKRVFARVPAVLATFPFFQVAQSPE